MAKEPDRLDDSVVCLSTVRQLRIGAANVPSLKLQGISILSYVTRLESLVSDLHASRRAEEASALWRKLDDDIDRHLVLEDRVLKVVSWLDDVALQSAVRRTRSEHNALRRLKPAVIKGLGKLAHDELPEHPTSFVADTYIFCEFTRMHAAYKRTSLYPLLVRVANG